MNEALKNAYADLDKGNSALRAIEDHVAGDGDMSGISRHDHLTLLELVAEQFRRAQDTVRTLLEDQPRQAG